MDESRIIARVSATGARRVVGVGTLAVLGLLLLWLLVAEPPADLPSSPPSLFSNRRSSGRLSRPVVCPSHNPPVLNI